VGYSVGNSEGKNVGLGNSVNDISSHDEKIIGKASAYRRRFTIFD
jgi:hypothetical protein